MMEQEMDGEDYGSEEWRDYVVQSSEVEGKLVKVLGRIRFGVAQSEIKKMPPLPIVSSTRTLGNGQRVKRSLYVDFANATQVTRVMVIAESIVAALQSGDRYRMGQFYESLISQTRSRYE